MILYIGISKEATKTIRNNKRVHQGGRTEDQYKSQLHFCRLAMNNLKTKLRE